VLKPQLFAQRAKLGLLRAAANQRQRRLGPAILNQSKRPDRRRHVVERVEIARRHQARAQRIALAEREGARIDDVRDDRRIDAEAAEHVDEKARRDDVEVDLRDGFSRDRRALQVVGGLAAAVVQDDRAAEGPRDQHRRQRRQQERRVRGREDVNDVGAPQLPDEERQVGELGRDRPGVFDVEGPAQQRRRQRVHRNEPRLDVRIVLPGA
jgi:hypothetical protein